MSLKSQHPPLTWSRIEQLARAGHDQFEVLTPPRARELVESVREHFGAQVGDVASRGEEDRQTLLATLESVRAIVNDRLLFSQMVPRIRAALASQPEARSGECPDKTTCAECADGPEAPKAGPLPVREHARRRGSLDGADAQALEGALSQVERDLAAANAKIADLVRIKGEQEAMYNRCFAERLAANARAANARADAAERERIQSEHGFGRRESELQRQLGETLTERDQLAQKLEAAERRLADYQTMVDDIDPPDVLIHWRQDRHERDQLAARVKELELELEHARQIVGGQPCEHEANQCTPEERNVLDVIEQAPAALVSAWQMPHGVVGWYNDFVRAVLANRAAKAKRGAK